MADNLIQSLWVTLFGMGLVFIAIVLLWLMMAGMTVQLKRKPKDKEDSTDENKVEKQRAAALAVATAFVLARQAEAHVSLFPTPPTAVVSAWQLSRRSENLNKQGKVRR